MLGLLPGSNKVNHYLSLIIDELIEFWNGIEILRTTSIEMLLLFAKSKYLHSNKISLIQNA